MKVYLLRGLWDVFSRGLDIMSDDLLALGIDAKVISGPDWETLVPEIVARRDAGQDSGPLVFVGHSFGADEAIDLARALDGHGVRVDRVILLESTLPPPVPANVDLLIHYYQPTFLGDWFPDTFAGNPVWPDVGNDHTDIRNIVISTRIVGLLGSEEYLNFAEHFYADDNPDVRTLLEGDVLDACGGAPRICGTSDARESSPEPPP